MKVETNGTVLAAASSSSSSNLTSLTWEREADKSTWTRYSNEHVKIITDAFKDGKTQVDITDGKSELSLIFERMVQRNKKSGWEKRIRCVSTAGSSGPDECKYLLNVAMVVYHLQKVSGKSGWKENGTQLFWVVPVENFWEQKNI